MSNESKLVSVIIPVYNCERYLGEAIESILAQDYRPLEVIVVNDGSTDNTEAIAKRYGNDITHIRQEKRGPAAARNKGLQMSHGEVIGFLDADDLWSENKLSLHLAHLAADPSLEIVLGLSQIMRLHEGDDKSRFNKWYDPVCLMLFGAAVMRKTVFEKVGFFDETLHHNEDTDWFMRVREMGVSMAIIQEVSLFYRRHNSNMSLNVAIRDSYFIRALKKSLDRRRQEGDGSVVPIPKLVDLERVTRNSQETTNCIEIEREQRKEP